MCRHPHRPHDSDIEIRPSGIHRTRTGQKIAANAENVEPSAYCPGFRRLSCRRCGLGMEPAAAMRVNDRDTSGIDDPTTSMPVCFSRCLANCQVVRLIRPTALPAEAGK